MHLKEGISCISPFINSQNATFVITQTNCCHLRQQQLAPTRADLLSVRCYQSLVLSRDIAQLYLIKFVILPRSPNQLARNKNKQKHRKKTTVCLRLQFGAPRDNTHTRLISKRDPSRWVSAWGRLWALPKSGRLLCVLGPGVTAIATEGACW